jgi:hypothetical protein
VVELSRCSASGADDDIFFFSFYQMMLMKIPCRRCVHSIVAVGDYVGVSASEFILKWQKRMMGEPKM